MKHHKIIKKALGIGEGFVQPYVGRKRTQNRALMYKIFAQLGYKKGAEIGVFKGDNALLMCENIPGLELICVDPWKKHIKFSDAQMKSFHMQTIDKLRQYHVTFLKTTSLKASMQIKDNSLDFVYLDGMSDFDSMMTDIIFWSAKVKKYGTMSGHDYFFGKTEQVVQAVNAYTSAHNYPVYLINDKTTRPSFFWIKL
jgi:hypothetical protein